LTSPVRLGEQTLGPVCPAVVMILELSHRLATSASARLSKSQLRVHMFAVFVKNRAS
jgi:hypothetical protein